MPQKTARRRRVELSLAKPDRIAMTLEREIRSGKLLYGERLQSENELVERFAVSRTTVRKGLEALADKGLITKRTGIGSFVTFDGQIIDNAQGWTRALANHDIEVKADVLRIELIRDPKLARQLKQKIGTFIAIDRVRSIATTGHAISIERSRVPYVSELKPVLFQGLTQGSLSRTLSEAGLIGHSGEEWVEIECASEADAALMRVPAGSPCLRTRRLVRAADGRVIEYVVSLLDPRHFALHLEF